jgi:hypothetical protein
MASIAKENERQKIRRLTQDYLKKLADLKQEHDRLLGEFIKALEKAKEEELRSRLRTAK